MPIVIETRHVGIVDPEVDHAVGLHRHDLRSADSERWK
jgi:hypothetical protein